MALSGPEITKCVQDLKDGSTTAWGRFVPAPQMYPFSRTISLGCDAKTLRQEQKENPSSSLSRLGSWLAKSSAEGTISRQEVVSTVPASLLGIEPNHVVLDLCAAPGSKTTSFGICWGSHCQRIECQPRLCVGETVLSATCSCFGGHCAAQGPAFPRTSHL